MDTPIRYVSDPEMKENASGQVTVTIFIRVAQWSRATADEQTSIHRIATSVSI